MLFRGCEGPGMQQRKDERASELDRKEKTRCERAALTRAYTSIPSS